MKPGPEPRMRIRAAGAARAELRPLEKAFELGSRTITRARRGRSWCLARAVSASA